jgi:hypothetical protein
MKKQVVLVGILLAAIITSVIGLEQQQSALARTSLEDRHVGFSDGCKGTVDRRPYKKLSRRLL